MKAVITSTEDSLLIDLWQKGDDNAFAQIYIIHSPFLFHYALKRVSSTELASDLIQELFLKLWAKKDKIEIKGELRAYLTLCLRNLIIDHYSKELVQNKYLLIEGRFLSLTDNGTLETIQYNDAKKTLKAAVSQLPEKMREVFQLSKEREYSIDEIAEELQISKQTVKNQLGSALKRLRVSFNSLLTLLPVLVALFFHQP